MDHSFKDSPRERVRVANSLARAYARYYRNPHRTVSSALFGICILQAFGGIDQGDTLLKLADLIDPTCTITKRHNGAMTSGSFFEYDLSCGHTVGDVDGEPPTYCPVCGRRIVAETSHANELDEAAGILVAAKENEPDKDGNPSTAAESDEPQADASQVGEPLATSRGGDPNAAPATVNVTAEGAMAAAIAAMASVDAAEAEAKATEAPAAAEATAKAGEATADDADRSITNTGTAVDTTSAEPGETATHVDEPEDIAEADSPNLAVSGDSSGAQEFEVNGVSGAQSSSDAPSSSNTPTSSGAPSEDEKPEVAASDFAYNNPYSKPNEK